MERERGETPLKFFYIMICAFRGMLSRKLIIILVNVYSRPKCMQASTEKNCMNKLYVF